jgi:NNP family nitrate/nitrite transporter-like MFS transporter
LDTDAFSGTTGGTDKSTSSSFRTNVGPLVLLTAIFFLNFITRIVFAPLMPEIEKDLGISHGTAGSLFFLISIGYFITLFGSGWVVARYTHKHTITFTAVVVGLALVGTAFSNSLLAIRLGLLLLGMAAGLYLPSGIATVTDLFSSRHWGKALGVHELAPNLGFIAAPLLSELLLIIFPWRVILMVLGTASVVAGLAFARFGRGGEYTGVAPSLASFKTFLVLPAFWIIMILFGLAISSTLGIYAMLPLYLVTEHNIDRNFANTLVGLSRISTIVMTLVGGWASDRFGPRKTLIIVFLLTGIATMLIGTTRGSGIFAAVFFQPILTACIFPASFAALSRISPPGTRNIAVSLSIPFAFLIGGGAVPAFIGFMGDTVSFSLGITSVGGLIITGSVLAYFLKLQADRDGG